MGIALRAKLQELGGIKGVLESVVMRQQEQAMANQVKTWRTAAREVDAEDIRNISRTLHKTTKTQLVVTVLYFLATTNYFAVSHNHTLSFFGQHTFTHAKYILQAIDEAQNIAIPILELYFQVLTLNIHKFSQSFKNLFKSFVNGKDLICIEILA